MKSWQSSTMGRTIQRGIGNTDRRSQPKVGPRRRGGVLEDCTGSLYPPQTPPRLPLGRPHQAKCPSLIAKCPSLIADITLGLDALTIEHLSAHLSSTSSPAERRMSLRPSPQRGPLRVGVMGRSTNEEHTSNRTEAVIVSTAPRHEAGSDCKAQVVSTITL